MKEFHPFRLDVADQSLWRDDQRIHLTPKAFAILSYLVARAGRLVTQNELLEAHWPDTFVQPEVLKSQILDIRGALGDRPKDPLFIETVPRRGYRFIAEVRDQEAAAQPVATPAAAAPALAPAAPSATIVGRERSLDELRACLQRAAGGERQIVFVTGEQGMGKTTLVEAFLQQAGASGIQFARGQCLEGFGMVKEPYYPVLEAMGQLSRGNQREVLARVLEGQAPTWLMQLPALLRPEHRETLQRELLGATRERMIREMCEALESLTQESTLILLFEDLHWTDHSTVDLIGAIAHRRSPARLLLIGTYRPVDLVLARHPLKQVAHSLKAHRLSREIAVSALGEEEIAEYLSRQAALGTEQLAPWIQKQTEGNPLFMVTVIEHLLELGHIARNPEAWEVVTPLDQVEVSVPDTLRQMIEIHIEGLSPREQLMLEAASVHGSVFSATVTAAALNFEADDVEDACQNLAQQNHIVRMAEAEHLPHGTFSQRFEFVHAVFRNVFYHRLTPARRAKLHRRIGEAIESAHPGDRAEFAAGLAGHFEQCGDWPRTLEYLSLASKIALRRFDYREAVIILEHELSVAGRLQEPQRTRAEVRALYGLSILQHALLANSRSNLEKLAEKAAACGALAEQMHALTALTLIRASEDCRACGPMLEHLESVAAQQSDPVARAESRALAISFRVSLFGWDDGLAKAHAAELAFVRETGDRIATANLTMDHGYLQWESSQYAACCRGARESFPVLLESGRLLRYLHGRDLLACNLVFLGQLGEALDILEESIDNARKNEAQQRLLMTTVFKAWVHLIVMDYQGVREMCSRVLPLLTHSFMLDRRYIAERLDSAAELGMGNHEAALNKMLALRDAIDRRPVNLSWYWRMPLQLDITEAWLASGNLAQARAEANRSLDVTLAAADRTWQELAWEGSARVALLQEDRTRAERDLEKALAAMQGFDVPLAAWRVHATAASVFREDSGRRRQHLESARAVVQRIAASLESRPALRQTFLSAPTVADLIQVRAASTST